ncbi:MAG: hypothetical protein ABJC10_07125 [Acidobacteriota bacterium]
MLISQGGPVTGVAKGNCFWKYAILATVTQFLVCVAIWISTFVVLLKGDPLMEAMVYFYWPVMWLMAAIGVRGEFGAILAGLLSGWVIYGALFGAIICAIKRLNSR